MLRPWVHGQRQLEHLVTAATMSTPRISACTCGYRRAAMDASIFGWFYIVDNTPASIALPKPAGAMRSRRDAASSVVCRCDQGRLLLCLLAPYRVFMCVPFLPLAGIQTLLYIGIVSCVRRWALRA
jgi:hypothetical protein